jgi:soluble lytic murein transglycosylase-like protein
VPRKRRLSAAAGTLGLGLGVAASAFAAVGDDGLARAGAGGEGTELRVIERGAGRLDRAFADHRAEMLSDRYRHLYAEAAKLDAAPDRNLVAAADGPSVAELEEAVDGLRDRIAEAREASEAAPATSGGVGLVGGVSQETLDAIAACESGGDPTAVNSAGYYGKYQFDLGTWQSVGGSGNPADAPEAEQDMRASMLYAQAGSSPWPVCGA